MELALSTSIIIAFVWLIGKILDDKLNILYDKLNIIKEEIKKLKSE